MRSFSLFVFSLIRVVMLVILSIYFFQMIDLPDVGRTVFVGAAIALFVVSHFIQMSGASHVLRVSCAGVDFLLIAGFGFLFPQSGYLYLIFFGVVSTTVFLMFTDKRLLWTFSISFVVVWALVSWNVYRVVGVFEVTSNIVNAMFTFYGAVVGTLIRNFQASKETIAEQYEQLTDTHVALQDAHRQLRSYAEQVEQLTAARERTEIAREIHDTVGHKMTALIVQLQLAQEMVKRDEEKSMAILSVCEQLTRESLHDIRMSVRALKEDSKQHFIESINELLQEFSALTKMETRLDVVGDECEVPSRIQPTVKRIIQEALTNAKKHGNAEVCVVSLQTREEELLVSIQDNGVGVQNVVPNFGLINMKERVSEFGGSFEVMSKDGEGFVITMTIPLREKSVGVLR
ncbi:sensor histidine kinase [Sporosarcina sp. OR05]|uniref:sensor histidine kinase n=1 Tax=Sporosarcina sp. OR05 TaxID=2969819 RepID=UPI00352ADB59